MILGADFASYQTSVDWETYARCGRSFALIKATEGTSYVNPLFESQLLGAQAAGLAVGCYHFHAWLDSAAEEAAVFVQTVRNLTSLIGVPLLVDFERGGYQLPPPPRAQAEFDRMLAAVEDLVGYPTLWYSSRGFLSDNQITPSERNGQWIAAWGSSFPAAIAPSPFWAIWQHATSQSLPGVPTPVDSDVFNGTVAQFRRYGKLA